MTIDTTFLGARHLASHFFTKAKILSMQTIFEQNILPFSPNYFWLVMKCETSFGAGH